MKLTNNNEIVTGIKNTTCESCDHTLKTHETNWCEACLYELPDSDLKQAFINKMQRRRSQ